MDTILLKNGFEPVTWIFTNLKGQVQFKDIAEIQINEVIKAFLINLNHN